MLDERWAEFLQLIATAQGSYATFLSAAGEDQTWLVLPTIPADGRMGAGCRKAERSKALMRT